MFLSCGRKTLIWKTPWNYWKQFPSGF